MPATKEEWIAHFLPEGEACAARRRELGDYVPEGAARSYAAFAAFDAMMKGPAYQSVDLDRANRIAEHMAGLPNGLSGEFARPIAA